MPSKKKKYNARFPAGRIKKIMQSDEEVGKVAQAVPIIISRTLELFVESMLTKTLRITNARNAKTLTPSHMKQCIMSENRFDFLRELVKNIPDINVAEDMEDAQSSPLPQTQPLSLVISNDSSISTSSHITMATSKRNHENDSLSACSSSSQWKYAKQHSLDSITNKAPNFYTQQTSTDSDNNDKPFNYSLKSNPTDDKIFTAQTPKLTRMESTPASFISNNNITSPAIISTKFLPITTTTTTTKLSSNDKQPILNFDFTQIPLMPLTASTSSQLATSSSNHSHSVANILKNDNKSRSTMSSYNSSALKNEMPSLPTEITQSSSSIKANPQTPPTVTPNSSLLTSAMQSHSTSIIPVGITISHGSNSLEMDEDYDNI